MELITDFIDKPFEDIKSKFLFKKLFENKHLERIDDRYYIEDLDKGIDMVLTDKKIIWSIHLFPNFMQTIPLNLNFYLSYIDIEMILGKATHYGGGFNSLYGEIPFWFRYVLKDYTIHFEFSKDKMKINMITIGTITAESYFLQDQN
jgi:hypothetical protein